jgi:hypothetical protein
MQSYDAQALEDISNISIDEVKSMKEKRTASSHALRTKLDLCLI